MQTARKIVTRNHLHGANPKHNSGQSNRHSEVIAPTLADTLLVCTQRPICASVRGPRTAYTLSIDEQAYERARGRTCSSCWGWHSHRHEEIGMNHTNGTEIAHLPLHIEAMHPHSTEHRDAPATEAWDGDQEDAIVFNTKYARVILPTRLPTVSLGSRASKSSSIHFLKAAALGFAGCGPKRSSS